MTRALPYLIAFAACVAWFALGTALAMILGRIIRGPARPERDEHQPRHMHSEFGRTVGQPRVIHLHASGDRA